MIDNASGVMTSKLRKKIQRTGKVIIWMYYVSIALAITLTCLIICLSYPVSQHHTNGDDEGTVSNDMYKIIDLSQTLACTLLIIIGSMFLIGKLRDLEQYHAQFRTEKRNILLTAILLLIGYVLRSVLVCLDLTVLSFVSFEDIGEFWLVQIDGLLAIIGNMMPLYYFLYQHTRSFLNEEKAQLYDSNLIPTSFSIKSPTTSQNSKYTTVNLGLLGTSRSMYSSVAG